MKINARAKGSSGEREFCTWLKLNLNLDFMPSRNLDQVRDGGADIMTVKPFAFEVKRCQGIDKRSWWLQISKACRHTKRTRVVVYRKNGQPWRFLISAKRIGLNKGFIQLEELEAIKWLNLTRNEVTI